MLEYKLKKKTILGKRIQRLTDTRIKYVNNKIIISNSAKSWPFICREKGVK